jgi:CO dehydrogenase maturation factor
LKTISDNYEYTVIDNEAGMEHLSRRTVQNIDYLFIVSDPTLRGIKSAGRISRLLIELDTRVGKKFLLLNCVQNPVSSLARDCIASEGLEVLAILPEDPLIRKCDDNGRPVYEIVPDSDLYRSLDKALASILPLQCKSEKIAKKIENQ